MARVGETGSSAPARLGRPRGGGKVAPYRAFLIACVEARPDITMPELAAKLEAEQGIEAHPASLSRFLCKAGFTYKKKLMASERGRSEILKARREWIGRRQPRMRLERHRLVFIDETSTNTKMIRLRGRAPRGDRLQASAPFGHWRTALRAGLRPLHRRPAFLGPERTLGY